MASIIFNRPELNWLQSMLFNLGEEKWPGSDHPDDDPSIEGVEQMGQNEHDFFQNLLEQVRDCIRHSDHVVDFDTRPVGQIPAAGLGKPQHDFFGKILIDYKNSSAGNYIFRGPYGTSYQEGGQFPALTGSANSNFTGQGAFPENQFAEEANIFNSILIKLGEVVFPPPPAPGSQHSPGEI